MEIKFEMPKELQTKSSSKLLGKALIELVKQDISSRFKQTREITDDDWEFCEQIDWHPVDELPMKKSFIKELKEAEKETPIKFNSVEELFTK